MPSITLGGVLVAIVVLSAVAILIGRATRSQGSVAHVLEEAARVNTARLAAPGGKSAGDITDPRASVQNGTVLRRSGS
jgi:hypothetical protein